MWHWALPFRNCFTSQVWTISSGISLLVGREELPNTMNSADIVHMLKNKSKTPLNLKNLFSYTVFMEILKIPILNIEILKILVQTYLKTSIYHIDWRPQASDSLASLLRDVLINAALVSASVSRTASGSQGTFLHSVVLEISTTERDFTPGAAKKMNRNGQIFTFFHTYSL